MNTMKQRNYLILIFLFIGVNVYAFNFPGNHPELLIGKEIRVLQKSENLQEHGYMSFYTDKEMTRIYAKSHSYSSKYNALVNKVFKVISCTEYKVVLSHGLKYRLLLYNPTTGYLYFSYSTYYEHSFPFEVIGGLEYPEGYLCKYVTKIKDKFDGSLTYHTPSYFENISFTRVKSEEGVVSMYMSKKTYSYERKSGLKGAYILLENGEKISKPKANIKVEYDKNRLGSKKYKYSAFFTLTKAEIAKLKAYKITDIRLYIYDEKIKDGEKYRQYINCITEH